VVEPISKQRMCICSLNLVDVVDGLTSARVMIRDLFPLKEATLGEKVDAGRAALIFLNTARANLDAAEGYCELSFMGTDSKMRLAMDKLREGDFVGAEKELEGALPSLKDVLRPCAQKRE